jgi:16S rRNA (uracil1498-N3)-methyltransferase
LTSNQFYVPFIDREAPRVVLDGAEHRHLARSARVKKGDEVRLFDAQGARCRARVESIGRERTTLLVVEVAAPEEPRLRLILVQALVPAKRMELLLEKGTELGVGEFVPVESARSLRNPAGRAERKAGRWERIAREAVKQSKGAAPPAVRTVRRLGDVLAGPPAGLRIVLSEHGGRPLRDLLLEPARTGTVPPASVELFVGPVGGWTEAEERGFREAGCVPASLGVRVLKSETAALAAAALITHFWGG